MPPVNMLVHGRGIQENAATRFSATHTELSFCHDILWRIWMFLSTMIQKILLPEISSSAYTIAAWNIARKDAVIMLVAHMFRIRRLRCKGFFLGLSLARKAFE